MSTGQNTILVIDDEMSILDIVRDGLTGEGYRVITADGGEKGLQAAQSHPGPIAVVVVDVVMPDISGPEVAERIRTTRPEMKVLFMSGFSHDIVLVHGIKEGDPFIVKPFSLDTLRRKIHELLETRPSPFARPPQSPRRGL